MSYLHVPRGTSLTPAWKAPSGRWVKRAFDLFVSLTGLLLLAPVFAVVAILVRLSSEGPIFYVAERVGQRYRTFPMYKFRTMYVDADQRLDDLRERNQYREDDADSEDDEDSCVETSSPAPSWQQYRQWGDEGGTAVLVDDEAMRRESTYRHRAADDESVFLKLENDPRVTPVGRFLRATSLDEIPQLLNVVLGHLSIVGNRPLPLYEAEKLTRDGDVERFLAPAGITGLWQVTTRGTADVTPEERISLDVEYARTCSLWVDFTILLRTLPALLQEEQV